MLVFFWCPDTLLFINAPDDVWNEYLDKLTTCIVRKHKSDIFTTGTDADSSMGTSSERCDGPSCCFGLNYVTESGKHFLSYLSINNLAVVTTFFKKNRYATWIYPRSKKTPN